MGSENVEIGSGASSLLPPKQNCKKSYLLLPPSPSFQTLSQFTKQNNSELDDFFFTQE
jgi:hypothetical protein